MAHSSNSMMGAEGFGSDSYNHGEPSPVGYNAGGGVGGHIKMPKMVQGDKKQMLEIGKESDKLKAMRMIIAEMARGTDQTEFFPNVVKCVVCKSLELKKLVYMYLVRYAEDLPDLALLSISTFQKGLKDPNQLIRASALRVLSSIRVPVIVPIMLIALKQASTDMSPYVRKTCAHSIPKLYSLAPMEKDALMEVLEKLLHDRTTIVLGSVLMAFNEICPERLDLMHTHYRKLCNYLVDIDEWGQVVILDTLLRYARTQFLDPSQGDVRDAAERPFYEEDQESSEGEAEGEENGDKKKKKEYIMDPDHRLLLRSALPLLQSRNPAVVIGVVRVYHYLAPPAELGVVVKPLIRLLSGNRESLSVALNTIISMMGTRKSVFEPYLKSFYVRSSDPTFVRQSKLEILTMLANEGNVASILREFQTYIKHSDRAFARATIKCIGRCAAALQNVTESCMQGLMALMNHKDSSIVAESVVVIKKLLQLNPSAHTEIIVLMAKMANTITVPMARASILWIIGEYSSHVPKMAPDVLRQMAKSFTHEESIVKLQILSLAAKLHLTNPKQTSQLTTYVLNLAKYDMNYDIRDRARMIKALISNPDTELGKHLKSLFLSEKPAPNLETLFPDSGRFVIGSMSHFVGYEINGYLPLPDFPEEAPDPSVRNVVEKQQISNEGLHVEKGFFDSSEDSDSDSDDSSEEESSEDSTEDSEEDSESQTEDDDDDDSGSSQSDSDTDESESGSDSDSASDSDSS